MNATDEFILRYRNGHIIIITIIIKYHRTNKSLLNKTGTE